MEKQRISPRHMELFVTVMTSKTLQEAAERLHVSQPAVTKAVRLLERETGLELFERTHARLAPTAAALRLLPHVRRALEEVGTAQRIALQLRGAPRGHVCVASTDLALGALLPRAVARLRERWSEATIEIIPEGTAARVIEAVARKEVDFGIAQRPGNRVDPASEVLSRTLCEQQLAVALPRGHRLAQLATLGPDDLRGEALIRARTESTTYDLVEAAFHARGVALRVVAEARSSFAICGLVLAGTGIGLINPMQLVGGVFAGLETRPFRPRIMIRTCAHHLASMPLSPTAEHLLECLLAVAAEPDME